MCLSIRVIQLVLMDEQLNQHSEQPEQQPQGSIQPEQTNELQDEGPGAPPQWQYQSGNLSPIVGFDSQPPGGTSETGNQNNSAELVHWNASEFVNHEKTSSWYLAASVIAILVSGLIYLLTRDVFSVIVIAVLAIAVSLFGALKPRILDYTISPDGISVGSKHFNYEYFRSFAVMNDNALPSIQLLPHKRFAVPITMYFAPADGDHIVTVLGDYLPFEHRERDLVDKITSRLKF